MNINFKISEQNYLTFQLYLAAKSLATINKRKKNRITVPIIYLICAIVLFFIDSWVGAYAFAFISILWYLVYPSYDTNHYRKHYLKYIKENYSSRINLEIHLELQNEHLLTSGGGSEAKISTNEIKEIVELKDLILIRLDVTQAFVIPKDQINDLPGLIAELKELAKKIKVNYTEELGWVWK